MLISFDMEFKIKNCVFQISPMFVSFLCLILLIDSTGIMLFGLVSAIIHEIGHIIFICFSKKKISRVSFQLGAIIIDSKGLIDYKNEFLIAMGGCLFNFLFFALFFINYLYTNNEMCFLFSASNFGLFIFNLIPIEGLDGMDLIRIIFLKKYKFYKANHYCKIISFTFIILMIFVVLSFCLIKRNLLFLIGMLYLIILILIFSKQKEHYF